MLVGLFLEAWIDNPFLYALGSAPQIIAVAVGTELRKIRSRFRIPFTHYPLVGSSSYHVPKVSRRLDYAPLQQPARDRSFINRDGYPFEVL